MAQDGGAEKTRVVGKRVLAVFLEKDVEALRQTLERDEVETERLRGELREWPDLDSLQRRLSLLEAARKEKEKLQKLNAERAARQAELAERSAQAEKEIHLLNENLTKLKKVRDKESARLKQVQKSLDKLWSGMRTEGELLRQGLDAAQVFQGTEP